MCCRKSQSQVVTNCSTLFSVRDLSIDINCLLVDLGSGPIMRASGATGRPAENEAPVRDSVRESGPIDPAAPGHEFSSASTSSEASVRTLAQARAVLSSDSTVTATDEVICVPAPRSQI